MTTSKTIAAVRIEQHQHQEGEGDYRTTLESALCRLARLDHVSAG